MSDMVPMTRAGYEKIKAEADHLQNVEMPKIEAQIGRAREEGDLSENAEYHGQREAKGLLQAKINLLRDKLARASIVDPAQMPDDKVAFGATVVVKDLEYDDEETFTLVGAGDEDYDTGRILITSPIGQGLLGKQVGDTAEIEVPKGLMRYEVLDIRYGEA
jgi:transcription elongation factor GreA